MTNEQIIEAYKNRKMTIREMATLSERSYDDIRRVLLKAGYHNGKVD